MLRTAARSASAQPLSRPGLAPLYPLLLHCNLLCVTTSSPVATAVHWSSSSWSSKLSSSSSSTSSSRWKQRQVRDWYARQAKVKGLMSRAAFKLLEIDNEYNIFKPNQLVVDLGYAPGSWSQVAFDRVRPHGQVVGIDLLPAQPPRGVASFQGDFLSPVVRHLVKSFIINYRRQHEAALPNSTVTNSSDDARFSDASASSPSPPLLSSHPSYIDRGRYLDGSATPIAPPFNTTPNSTSPPSYSPLVHVVLSDMSAPWERVQGFNSKTLNNPYRRLMNTSGNAFRDHAGSMDLCAAALEFASDTLKPGGHFVCKFYQGAEDQALEQHLKRIFTKVYRDKPQSSRSESRESYFVALRRKAGALYHKPE